MNTFFSTIKDKVTGAKDMALSQFGKFIIVKWGLDKYGMIESLSLQSGERRIDAKILLKGELYPIDMGVDYRIESIGGQSFFIADQVTFSREWANLAFQDLCPPNAKRMEIHSAIAALL
jgi:hypothetical protein